MPEARPVAAQPARHRYHALPSVARKVFPKTQYSSIAKCMILLQPVVPGGDAMQTCRLAGGGGTGWGRRNRSSASSTSSGWWFCMTMCRYCMVYWYDGVNEVCVIFMVWLGVVKFGRVW